MARIVCRWATADAEDGPVAFPSRVVVAVEIHPLPVYVGQCIQARGWAGPGSGPGRGRGQSALAKAMTLSR